MILRLLGYVIAVCLATSARAAVLVNEVMVNEPGASTTLEWVELYNDSSDQVSLSTYSISTSFGEFLLDGSVGAGGYFIICRRLVGPTGTPGFETIWGNNSGVWGDTPEEAVVQVLEVPLALNNNAGFVRLIRAGVVISELTWSSPQPDGVSLERSTPVGNQGLPSVDPSGSTPGRLNSVSPAPDDLGIVAAKATPQPGTATVEIRVKNEGTSVPDLKSLVVYVVDPLDSLAMDDTVATLSIINLLPTAEDTLSFPVALDGIYIHLGAQLSFDDRPANNHAFFVAPGTLFPPIILAELLPDPEAPLQSEWVELHNISDSTFDLNYWKLGDSVRLRAVSTGEQMMAAGERVVAARDSFLFRQYYTGFSGVLVEPSTWEPLNNAGDALRLVDSFGFTADQVEYSSGLGDNYTLSRNESDSARGAWVRSAMPGGTPGEMNQVQPAWQSGRISLDISPRVFSPDGDGHEDSASIAVTAAEASAYSLKIYDREGRLVRILAEGDLAPSGKIPWDGRSDAGNRLPIGIYICIFEAEGLEAIKQTVVIAR